MIQLWGGAHILKILTLKVDLFLGAWHKFIDEGLEISGEIIPSQQPYAVK